MHPIPPHQGFEPKLGCVLPVALEQVGQVDVICPAAGGQDVADGGPAAQVQHAASPLTTQPPHNLAPSSGSVARDCLPILFPYSNPPGLLTNRL